MTKETLPKIILSKIYHKGNHQILIKFSYHEKIVSLLKTIDGCFWSKTHKGWYIRNNPENLKLIFSTFRGIATINSDLIFQKKHPLISNEESDTLIQVPKSYTDLLIRRRYSKSTIKTYSSFFKDFIKFLNKKPLQKVTESDIRKYQDYLVREKKIAISSQNQAINAIKFYFEKVLGGEKRNYYIERPRKERKLPNILSENEVFSILKVTKNIKHKFIISLLYSSGLRISELINLRKTDVLLEKNLLFVRGGKGKKDRTTIFAENLKKLLALYLENYKPNYWLFEGYSRKQYSTTSIVNIIKKSTKLAMIERNVTAHMFRHSFATHMLEQGIDLRYIQSILGHESSKTTEIYTHVTSKFLAKIKSPLDTFLERQTLDKKGENKN